MFQTKKELENEIKELKYKLFITESNLESCEKENNRLRAFSIAQEHNDGNIWMNGFATAADKFSEENASLRNQLTITNIKFKELEKELDNCKRCVKCKGHPHVKD
ncbi:MAG: hypothetical protein J6S67_04930 [Methanobrevibacter sp.]|nr:hypothetical protein [Methanobrevibacter sp.]